MCNWPYRTSKELGTEMLTNVVHGTPDKSMRSVEPERMHLTVIRRYRKRDQDDFTSSSHSRLSSSDSYGMSSQR